jgi:uncharacterized protein with HEPN domain
VPRRRRALPAADFRSLKEAPGLLEEIVPNQPWSGIRAIGNVLRHEYDRVEPAMIWRIVEKDLVPLRRAVEKAIRILGDRDE